MLTASKFFRLIFILILIVATANAEVPRVMTYQGRLTDAAGNPYTGAKNVIFQIYNAAGTAIWSSGSVSVTFTDGLFSVALGRSPQPPIPSANWQSDTLLTLGITVPPDPELTPRQRFLSSGYAFTAKTADVASSIIDNTISSSKIVNGSILFQDLGTNGASEGKVIKYQGGSWVAGDDSQGPASGWTDAGSVVYNTNVSDSVGIGTAVPRAKLDVSAESQMGVQIVNSSDDYYSPTMRVVNPGLNTALFYNGSAGSTPVWPPVALYARSTKTDGIAAWLESRSPHYGALQAYNSADSGLGIFGGSYYGTAGYFDGETALECVAHGAKVASLESNSVEQYSHVLDAKYTGSLIADHVAVSGQSNPADYYGVGGSFSAGYVGVSSTVMPTGNHNYYGIQSTVAGGTGSNYGIYAIASGAAVNYAIYGQSYGTGTNWAGYFGGDIQVTGTVWRSAEGFRIDHPLDPENQYLQHSSVESDEMKNIYDGIATLDATGKATVELPDWFSALNGEFRYQLTCIGGYSPVYISSEISSNRFEIAGGSAGMKVSWQVTGVRLDKFAQANQLAVVKEKPANEKGRYLTPAAFGVGEDKSVTYDPQRTPADRAKQQALRDNLAKTSKERIAKRSKPQTVEVKE